MNFDLEKRVDIVSWSLVLDFQSVVFLELEPNCGCTLCRCLNQQHLISPGSTSLIHQMYVAPPLSLSVGFLTLIVPN
jgi:hypothetical protein